MINFSEVERAIRSSYFNQNEEKTREVLDHLQTLSLTDPKMTIDLIARRKEPDLIKWNLYAVAWRTIERSIEWPFKVGETVIVEGEKEKRVIKAIFEKNEIRMVSFGNFACSLSMLRYPEKEKIQLSMFDDTLV